MEKMFIEKIEAVAIRQRAALLRFRLFRGPGSAQITVEYAWNKDMDEAFLDLQKALTSFSQNSLIDALTITQLDPNTQPVVIVGLSHETDNRYERAAQGGY